MGLDKPDCVEIWTPDTVLPVQHCELTDWLGFQHSKTGYCIHGPFSWDITYSDTILNTTGYIQGFGQVVC